MLSAASAAPAEARDGGGARRGGGQQAATSPRFRGLTLVNHAFVNPVYGRDTSVPQCVQRHAAQIDVH